MAAASADVNLDGRQDIIYASYDPQHHKEELFEAKAISSDSFGTAQKIISLDALHPTSLNVWTADLNQDGSPDLILYLGDPEHSLLVSLSRHDTAYTPPAAISKGPVAVPDNEHLVVADVNADGIPDIAIENELKKSIQLYVGRGNGTFLPAIRLASTEEAGGFTLEHLTGGAIPQLIVTDAVHGNVKIISIEEQ
jgi:hypothetical protein